jgi:hypothetical protein
MCTSACWRCAAACATCPGTASSPGASRRRVNGGRLSGTRARNTRHPRRWWICPSPPSAWARQKSRWAAKAHQINVKAGGRQGASYPVRGKAQVTITATLPNGKPAAHAEVALAAVDQALLELMPNTSWNVLDAMLQRRSWGVADIATAQMEIIGQAPLRPQGRSPRAAAGGAAPTRELLDTLLLWKPAGAARRQWPGAR